MGKHMLGQLMQHHCCLQVDVMQVAIVQFCDRPGRPVYCVEQLIEGDYIKYNSNSGFVKVPSCASGYM